MKEERSRKRRRVRVRTPGGKNKIIFKRRKPSPAKCSECGIVLKGVPLGIISRIKKLSKTQRRPERAYGGNLCSKCSRRKIIRKVRGNV